MPAYKKTPSAMAECVGPSCGGCSSGNCYAKGGRVPRHEAPSSKEAGVHEPISRYQDGKEEGISIAGKRLRSGDVEGAKYKHKTNLEDLKNMPKPELYAKGGAVKGVHEPNLTDEGEADEYGSSSAGTYSRSGSKSENPVSKKFWNAQSKLEHKRVLGEMRDMKKPNLYAEGGEVDGDGDEDADDSMDEELKHAMGGELMDALERKDRKGIMSALEAIVMTCRRN